MYQRLFEAESKPDLSHLTDPSLVGKIAEFIRTHPYPKDHESFHKFAEEQLGLEEASVAEGVAYAMLSVFLAGGRSFDATPDYHYDADQEAMGKKVEEEHLDVTQRDNPVVAAIIELFRTKISHDHQSESTEANKGYYTGLKEMEKSMEAAKQ